MANNINLITKYGAENLDEQFFKASVTSVLEADQTLLKFVNAKTVMIPDYTISGLGDYSRSTGYPEGDVTVTWSPYSLNMDRGRSFTIDAMDDEETAGIAFGKLASEFMRTKVVPEVDAYRISTLLANAKDGRITKSETITAANVISKFNADDKAMEDLEISHNECIRFVSYEIDMLLKESTQLEKKITMAEYTSAAGLNFKLKMYDEVPLIPVPKARFMSAYDFGDNGFTPKTGACEINYLTVHRNAALAIKKHENIKVFSPQENQKTDGWMFKYRLYHDIITPKHKQDGISASIKGAALYTAE